MEIYSLSTCLRVERITDGIAQEVESQNDGNQDGARNQ
jgi:hypothetical protein